MAQYEWSFIIIVIIIIIINFIILSLSLLLSLLLFLPSLLSLIYTPLLHVETRWSHEGPLGKCFENAPVSSIKNEADISIPILFLWWHEHIYTFPSCEAILTWYDNSKRFLSKCYMKHLLYLNVHIGFLWWTLVSNRPQWNFEKLWIRSPYYIHFQVSDGETLFLPK